MTIHCYCYFVYLINNKAEYHYVLMVHGFVIYYSEEFGITAITILFVEDKHYYQQRLAVS